MATVKKKYTAEDFLTMFREVKSKEKGRKNTTRALIGRTEANFAKLIKAKYTPEDFEKATVAMFNAPDQWAVSTGNDTPEHLLQPDNFSRYLNSAENPVVNKPDGKPVLNYQSKPAEQTRTDRKLEQEDAERLADAKERYTRSLEKGEWQGNIFHAMLIGALFTDSFQPHEKRGFLVEARKQVTEWKERRTGSTSLAGSLESMARGFETNIMYEVAVLEAVKRKIPEPWK